MITADGLGDNVWATIRSLCNDLMDLDRRAAHEGWSHLGGSIADAAVEVLAEVSSGCCQADADALARLRSLSALRRAGEGLLRLQRLIRTGERARHLTPAEARQLSSRAKDASGMLVALGVVMRAQGSRPGARDRLWS